MRILFVYPKFAEALWAYKHALEYIQKKTSSPPLGLLTVAAMLPSGWEKKLVDLNVSDLSDAEILSADYVFISAMLAQQNSANQILSRCKKLGIPTVAGGPLFSFAAYGIDLVEPDHKFCGEAEVLIDIFLKDLHEHHLRPIYTNHDFPDIQQSPVPLWKLVENFNSYTMMTLQFTRGCPYNCEFCDVVALNGHRPRIKTIHQMLRELDALYEFGWKGHIFICDDNFIGNNRRVREPVLGALIEWMREHHYPFTFSAAVSVDLADHPDIMDKMVAAGFDRVTIGIESPNVFSLEETNKLQNLDHNLLDTVRKIQSHGLEVQGGFIVGFDHDPPGIFDEQIQFIQASGIATAMVSMLFAFPGSRLYDRLNQEKRLLAIEFNESTYGVMNFEPRMGIDHVRQGHLYVLDKIYSPEFYYQRLVTFLDYYRLPRGMKTNIQSGQIWLLLKVIRDLGIVDDGRRFFWKLIWYGFKKQYRALPMIIRLTVTGYNFRKDISSYRMTLSTTT